MSNDDLIQLCAGLLHDPFRVLGGHSTGNTLIWRASLPFAVEAAIETVHGYEPMRRTDARLFEWQGQRADIDDHPRIHWLDDGGYHHESVDPYSFEPQLPTKELRTFREGIGFDSYRFLGAHPRRLDGIDGIQFSVWAPNARRVSVVGDFNRWHGFAHPMVEVESTGVWTIFIPDLTSGTLYKFELTNGARTWLKADPVAFRAEHRPGTASLTTGSSNFEWHDHEWLEQRARTEWLHAPMSVYEVHLGSWGAPGSRPHYRSLGDTLVDYARAMGFTHLELMPITEHPLDDSWGYQTTGYFAPTSRFGEPDDLRYLIDQAHAKGLGVILDWTPAHFPKDAHGLAYFDGTYLFEHAEASRREHPDWNTLVFNYGRNEVRSFLFSSAAYWLDQFHFDGLRVDAVSSMLYLDYSRGPGQWIPNEFGGNENLTAIAFLRELNSRLHAKFPGAVVIAEESTAWPMVSRPTYVGGLGFSMKWNLGWMHDTLAYLHHDPVHRQFHHDALTFTMLYAFSENFVLPLSHDEVVHGKGSLLSKMPGDRWQQLANLRLLLAYQYVMPGKKLLFMGAELGAEHEWNFREPLDWRVLDHASHAGVRRLVQDLNTLLREVPALHRLDFDVKGFDWIDCHDNHQSVISFLRRAVFDNAEQQVICVLNFTPVPRQGYRVGVPEEGVYRELLNSDAALYGGSNLGNGGSVTAEAIPWMGRPWSVSLTLPPLGALILARQEFDLNNHSVDGQLRDRSYLHG